MVGAISRSDLITSSTTLSLTDFLLLLLWLLLCLASWSAPREHATALWAASSRSVKLARHRIALLLLWLWLYVSFKFSSTDCFTLSRISQISPTLMRLLETYTGCRNWRRYQVSLLSFKPDSGLGTCCARTFFLLLSFLRMNESEELILSFLNPADIRVMAPNSWVLASTKV